MLAHVLRLLHEKFPRLRSDVCGVMYDSCPGAVGSPLSWYRAFSQSSPPTWLLAIVRAAVAAGGVAALAAAWRLAGTRSVTAWLPSPVRWLLSFLSAVPRRAVVSTALVGGTVALAKGLSRLATRRYWRTLSRLQPPAAPALFLYSRSDPLISYKHVEAVASLCKQEDRTVQCAVWTDSTHVNHLRAHPAEYAHEVQAFAVRCVARHRHCLSSSAFATPALGVGLLSPPGGGGIRTLAVPAALPSHAPAADDDDDGGDDDDDDDDAAKLPGHRVRFGGSSMVSTQGRDDGGSAAPPRSKARTRPRRFSK